MKNIRIFYLKIFISVYLNRHVFVMLIMTGLSAAEAVSGLSARNERFIKLDCTLVILNK